MSGFGSILNNGKNIYCTDKVKRSWNKDETKKSKKKAKNTKKVPTEPKVPKTLWDKMIEQRELKKRQK